MRLKPLFFGTLFILLSTPGILFLLLSIFKCGFISDKLCCDFGNEVCCFGLKSSGCITILNSMEETCRRYCFELQSRATGGLRDFRESDYCEENCTSIFPCYVSLLNGTSVEVTCE
ncbi:hypothetical protein DRN62_03385 [Nanoarchaeota archaeon]|nr:MAG: hypothetical protein DRN62_03385 [Nanoarchaeota archaeon]